MSTRFSKATVVLMGVCLLSHVAMGDYMIPPMGPTWWTVPPENNVRLQYHSFITDPDLNLEPDYTLDGYTPSVSDDWNCPDSYNNVLTPPQLSDWGDGKAIRVEADEDFSKLMGNRSNVNVDKEYFVEMVFRAVDGQYGTFPESPELDITAPGSIYEHEGFSGGDGKNGWWRVSWSGTIMPQPAQETFTFYFSEAVYVDSVWIGTYCVPEPGTLSLLLLGGLVVSRKRRT